MTPPMIPERAYGSTASQIISQRVAPSASAASRCERGTAMSTSRVTAEMYGSTMIARMQPAASMLGPYAGPEKSGRSAEVQRVLHERHHVLAKQRHQDEHAPEAVDDARNRRQQIDEKRDRLPKPPRREFGEEDRNADARAASR